MEYFTLLNLKKEPFSNSPDPELFFNSNQHKSCLQKLELAIHLKRGLSVVIGDIGTGKSTLSRQLVRILAKTSEKTATNLILDPEFTSPHEFLQTIVKTFNITISHKSSEWQLKEAIKNHLFQQGVDLNIIPVLIIDEGQKLPGFCLEILREFLNYETNQHKLLQIIIFAQEEFKLTLKKKANFADRITTLQHLYPLSRKETKAMIQFRIDQTREDSAPKKALFSPAALLVIHLLTRGYPRKIMMLCSKIILDMLVKNRKVANVRMVFAASKETSFSRVNRSLTLAFASFIFIVILATLIVSNLPAKKIVVIKNLKSEKPTNIQETQETKKTVQLVDNTNLPTTQQSIKKPAPTILGQLTVEKGLSLGYMISSVYGKFTTKRASAVMAANPEIKDPNQIQFGTKINFPELGNKIKRKQGKFILELARSATLQEGYNFIRNSKELSHDLMLRKVVKQDDSSYFQVIMKQHYNTRKLAQKALKQVPNRYNTIIENYDNPES